MLLQVKHGIIRAINEEIGIEASTLTDAFLLELGRYADEGRDPRYWEYSWLVNGEDVRFGMKRGSETNGYVIYLKSNTNIAPKEIDPLDTEEVNSKWWANLNTVLRDYDDSRWMILDHKKFIPDTMRAISDFKKLSSVQQQTFRFQIPEDDSTDHK